MGQDGSWEGVYGQFLNPDGSPSRSEFRLNTTTVGRQMHGTVISDNAERFLTLWTSLGSLASGFDPVAQVVAPAAYVPSAPISTVFAPPASDPFPIILPPSAIPLSPVAPSSTNVPSLAAQSAPTLDPLPPLLPLSGNAPSNAIAQAQGAYNGLIYNVSNVTVLTSGFFTASTTAKGAYSANLLIAGRHYPISGKFSPLTGLATNSFKLISGQSLTVRLRLDLSGTDRLQGLITDRLSAYWAQLDADRLIFTAANPAPQRGSYTIAIPPATSGPAGYGYGTMTVSPGGVLQWSGVLADGTKVSQTSALSKDGLWPLYSSLYGGAGAAISWMQFNAALPASDLSGQFIWIKPAGLGTQSFPAGFTNAVAAVGSAYTPPSAGPILNLTNLDLIFSGGALPAPFTNSLRLDRLNRVSGAPASLKLTFTPASGLFKGSSWSAELNQTLTFQGVVYEKVPSGAGLFLTPGQSGQVYLGGAPPAAE